ncbi:glycosyltransferase [Phormidium yuhuli AB48]|uniref:Glycosyltransferase n=1 Tax=Phormidium yuhuli AB48 TaxID=2940671 RepID=A0ABY5ARP8_9CYAN|nr:glycosyltransferase [Phormidium yuhuli]USR91576.1 glycosyltransferase [Phormidium yuhuli AB48]
MRLIVEGWRFISQSYAVVNQFQLLELLNRPDVQLYHREMPYLLDWQAATGLLSPEEEARLRAIPEPPDSLQSEAVLRMHMPFDFSPSNHSRHLVVFGLTEYGKVHNAMVQCMGVQDFGQAHRQSEATILTASNWSRQGFINSGADGNRIRVVPLGVNPQICYPLAGEERQALRRHLGIGDEFVFLNVSSQHPRKGIRPLLKAFAQVVLRHPQARLVLKGTTGLYGSQTYVQSALNEVLAPQERDRVLGKLAYIGQDLSFAEVVQLYQGADAYISPYLAEGFNLPVLEAIACGTPVICTAGGPTDDFTQSSFAIRVEAEQIWQEICGEQRLLLSPSIEALVAAMERVIDDQDFRNHANRLGPQFVQNNYTWSKTVDHLVNVLWSSMEHFSDVVPV